MKAAKKPTVLDVLGPTFHHRAREVYIDNTVLEGETVEEKDDILRQGEEEKRKRRDEKRINQRINDEIKV